MVSERKFLDSQMEAELHFLELIDRGIENQKDTSRKLDTLNKQLQEIKEMVTAITSRLPAPTSPLHTPEVSNPSISSSKTTLKFDAPPDLAGSGNLMNDDDLLVEVLENDDDFLKHDEKRAPMGTITESNVGKRAADLVAHQVFEEMPETQPELKQAKLKAPEMTDLKNASLLLLIRSESAENSEMVARKMFEDMPREKEPPQIQIRDELNVENEISCLEARQVFGEMLELQQKLKQPKLKVFEVNSLQNATSSLLVKNHVLLNAFSPSVDYLRKMCFDPGGSSLLNVVYSPNRKCVLRDNDDLWCIEKLIEMRYVFGAATVSLRVNQSGMLASNYSCVKVTFISPKCSLEEATQSRSLADKEDTFKLLNDFTAQDKMMNDHAGIVCFDPGEGYPVRIDKLSSCAKATCNVKLVKSNSQLVVLLGNNESPMICIMEICAVSWVENGVVIDTKNSALSVDLHSGLSAAKGKTRGAEYMPRNEKVNELYVLLFKILITSLFNQAYKLSGLWERVQNEALAEIRLPVEL